MNATTIREPNPARFLAVSGLLVALLLFAILSANYGVDPYLIHGWGTSNLERKQPELERLMPWGKTYTVYKYQPQVLYVGNSRTVLGLPADETLFSDKRVFNAGLLGATVSDAMAMVRHARWVTKLETVVWGIDYQTFSPDIGNTDFDRKLVATSPHYALQSLLLDLRRALSLDMTEDTINVLLGRREKVCQSNLAFRGQRDEACEAAHLQEHGGVATMLKSDIHLAQRKNDKMDLALPSFQSTVAQLCNDGVRVLLYVNPKHAITLETAYESGLDGDMERWMRAMVGVVDPLREQGCHIQLFDFSGFNSITSETIPPVSGKPAMDNYWEGSHCRTGVGRQMLAKMIPRPEVPVAADFGIELDHRNINTHLAHVRAQRNRYVVTHPGDVAFVKQWMDANAQSQ